MSLEVGVMTSRSGPILATELEHDAALHVTRIPSPDHLAPHIGNLEVLIASNDLYVREVAEAVFRAPRLQWLQIVSSGYDNVLRYGAPARITVTRGGPNHAPAVAEHAAMLLLALVRRLPQYERNRIVHKWDRQGLRFRMGSLEEATAVIVGFGAIGREVAKRLRPFGMRIIGVKQHAPADEDRALADRIVSPDSLGEVLPHADAVILSVPLSPQTSGLIGAAQLASMKASAYIVNVARGPVVDTAALLNAIAAGTIAGAALDVFDEEPLSPDDPLWDCEDVIISPHVAGAGGNVGTNRTIALVKENISRFRRNRPLLNPVSGYPQEELRA